jgi:hypothetical protein
MAICGRAWARLSPDERMALYLMATGGTFASVGDWRWVDVGEPHQRMMAAALARFAAVIRGADAQA